MKLLSGQFTIDKRGIALINVSLIGGHLLSEDVITATSTGFKRGLEKFMSEDESV